MQRLIPRTMLSPLFAAILCIGFVSAPAQAQAASTEAKKASSPLAMQMEARKISMQLRKIEQKAIVNDAALQEQRKNFSDDVEAFMRKKGYKPRSDKKQLLALRKKILSGKLNKKERATEIKKFQKIRARLQKGQMEALQNKRLMTESQRLGQATIMAMEKQDPNTDKLLKRLKEISRKLVKMREAAAKSAKH